MEAWRDGGMEAWRHGEMKRWRHGGMEGWRDGEVRGKVAGIGHCWQQLEKGCIAVMCLCKAFPFFSRILWFCKGLQGCYNDYPEEQATKGCL